MKFPLGIDVYGDITFRGKCPTEGAEHLAFVGWLTREHPDYSRLLIHPKNEGKRTHFQSMLDKAMGCLNTGASDLIILGNPSFVCELKRQDHTKSRLEDEQKDFLGAAKEAGCFACIALGAEGAISAFETWRKDQDSTQKK